MIIFSLTYLFILYDFIIIVFEYITCIFLLKSNTLDNAVNDKLCFPKLGG